MAPSGAETGPMPKMRRTGSLGRPRSAFRAPRSALHEVLYCGYRWDPETGLYHVRHRSYDPTLGRWLSRDPIGYSDGMSLYEYARSSPSSTLERYGTSTRILWAESDIAIDAKEIHSWKDFIHDHFSWWPYATKGVDQSCDFKVYLRTDWEIALEVVGPTGPGEEADSATVVSIPFTTYSFVRPTEYIVGAQILAQKPLARKLCRKTVYLKQECCVEHRSFWSGKRTRKTEDRYLMVRLYGKTVAPENSIPRVLQCDVSGAEADLAGIVGRANAVGHSLCTSGLDLEGERFLSSDGRLRTSLPSSWWTSTSTVPYVKSEHHSLVLHSRGDYIEHY